MNKDLKEIIKLLVEENSILLGPDGYGLSEMEIENVTKNWLKLFKIELRKRNLELRKKK